MIYLTAFSILAVAFGQIHRLRAPALAACVAAAVLATMAALRGADVGRDFLNYQEWYQFTTEDASFLERPFHLEAIYFGLNDALSSVGLPFRAFLWGIAAISIFIKAKVILSFSSRPAAPAIALLVFALTFYLLHDFSQVRAGAAVALLFAGLLALANGSRARFLCLAILACGFHAAAVFGLLFLLPAHGRRSRVVDAIFVLGTFAALASALADTPAVGFTSEWATELDPRLAIYVEYSLTGISEAANPFSVPALLALALALSLFVGRQPPETVATGTRDRVAITHLRRSILAGVCCLALLYAFRDIGLRLYELSVSFIPLAAAILFSRKRRILPKLLLVLWCVATAYIYVFRENPLVEPYMMSLS